MAASLILQHKVVDYDNWRVAFDAHEPARVEATITNPRVYRGADDPLDIVMMFDVADADLAQEFMGSPLLRDVMKEAGVVNEPTFCLIEGDDE